MALSTDEEVKAILPKGTGITSGFRTAAHNAEVGGVPNSFHTRGSPQDPHALDLTPAPGQTMADLRNHIASSGVPVEELLNEGDHVHVGFSGVPSSRDPGGTNRPGYRVVSSQDLAPEDTPESLAAQGYKLDPATNTYARTIGEVVGSPPQPLDTQYAERQASRESQALDQEQADLSNAVQAGAGISDSMAGAVIKDVGKGIFVEGGQAAISGIKRGVNEMVNMMGAVNDATIDRIPGEQQLENGIRDTTFRVGKFVRGLFGQKDDRSAEAFRAEPQARLPTNEAERPTSVTGSLIEGVSQFATGMIAGGEVLKPLQAISKVGSVGKALAQGAIADFSAFDGNQARLSNILADHSPAAIAPMFEFLEAQDDDPELLGRFKSAIEGAGLGVATDLLVGGVRGLRAARVARRELNASAVDEGLQVPPDLAADAIARAGAKASDDIRAGLGNPEGPRFKVKAEAPVVTPDFRAKVDAQAADVTGALPADLSSTVARAQPSANVFDINLARIETPEDVQATITGMADRLRDNVDLARRAQRSWDQTREAAGNVDWVQSMAERRTGDAVNAETALAYREAVNASASQVLDLARKVQDEPTLANQYAFRRATAAHSAIQNELMGARAEAGRALNAFRIPAGTPATALRQIDSLMADAGGANAAKSLADRIINAADKGDVALNQMIQQGALARSRDLIKFAYTNSLLSGIGTPIINTVGNGMMMGLNLASRAVSPRLAGAFGGESVTRIGEAHALLAGYQGALRDIFKLNPLEAADRIGANAGEALRRDGLFRGMAPGLDDAAPAGIKLRSEREEAGAIAGADRPMSAAAWRVDEDTVLGRTLDVMNMLMSAPSNINALTDDVFKTIAARGELHAQAFRKVSSEGLQGEAARVRMQSLLENPSDDMLKTAEQEMHDLTFTRQTPGMAAAFSDLRRSMDNNFTPIPWGTMALPFVKTPANLISMGMQYAPLAPFSRRFRDALAEGGAAAEQAKAKMAVGTALWSVWMGMAMDGQITGAGPGNGGQRDAMARVDENGGAVFQPYSVRLGDRWFSFERADPLGQGLSLIGDMADLMKNADWDSDQQTEWSEVAAHAVSAIGQAFFDKTILKGASELTSALLDGTDAQAERLLMQRTSGAIPGSSVLRMVRRGEDPYLRETWNVVSAIKNTVPGFSEGLPPQRDLWGKPRTYQTGLGTVYDSIVPVQTRAGGGSAIDLEILNNGVSVAMPGRSISVMGETVSLKNRPDIYSRFLELSGQPAFEKLNSVVSGTDPDSEFYFSLDDGPSGGKAEYIKDVISSYRQDARGQVQVEFASDLQRMATERVRSREAARAQ